MQKYRADIRLHERNRLVPRVGKNCSCRVRADAGKRVQFLCVARHNTVMFAHNNLCRTHKEKRAPVISESAPRAKHRARWRVGERADTRKHTGESLVKWNH